MKSENNRLKKITKKLVNNDRLYGFTIFTLWLGGSACFVLLKAGCVSHWIFWVLGCLSFVLGMWIFWLRLIYDETPPCPWYP